MAEFPVGTVLEARCTCGSGLASHGPQYVVESIRESAFPLPALGPDAERGAYKLRNLSSGRRHATSRRTIQTGYIVVAAAPADDQGHNHTEEANRG